MSEPHREYELKELVPEALMQAGLYRHCLRSSLFATLTASRAFNAKPLAALTRLRRGGSTVTSTTSASAPVACSPRLLVQPPVTHPRVKPLLAAGAVLGKHNRRTVI